MFAAPKKPETSGTTILTNVLCRDRELLDGGWQYIVDPYDTGHRSLIAAGYQMDATQSHPGERIEYNFDSSGVLQVPGDWNTQHPELHYYEGTLWYRKRFLVEEEYEGRTFVYFGAANHTARVFLDGEKVATHVGGFGPFAVEVTGGVAPGEHSLVVQVNNRREPDRIPAMSTDWWNFGGLTRSVSLIRVPSTFLEDAWLTMAPDGSIIGGVTINGDESATAAVEFCGHTLDVIDGSVHLPAEIAAEIERWHPGTPVLHEVRWTCGQDTIVDRVGFRTVRTEGNRIFVNDQETYLRGISIHGEGPSGGRRAHGPDDAATLLGWAVDLGCNFVRLAHYQHDEHMVKAADELGLLAWTELPVYWGIDWGDERVLGNGLQQTDELVCRDRSRACVILWSIANETFPGDERTRFLAALVDRARSLDPTRLLTAALLTLPSEEIEHHVDDDIGDLVDVLAINQYLGWYYGSREDLARTRFTTTFGKPIVFSELGAGAKFGRHGGDDEIWTEEFQAAVYEAQIEMISQQPDCVGLSPWILKDFRTPMRVLPGVQDGYNRKGLVSEEGERKLAFGVLENWYRGLPAEGPPRG